MSRCPPYGRVCKGPKTRPIEDQHHMNYGVLFMRNHISTQKSKARHGIKMADTVQETPNTVRLTTDFRELHRTYRIQPYGTRRYITDHTFDKNLVILYKTSQDPTRLQDTAKVLQDRKTAKPEMILTRSLVRF
ncbi:hypothetical protein K438DRAFT_1756089 [Mycena galopus ATCC 62051]|nr:hypothetical protein K438DRAFT_1756089 [Mycena galopus ATCC 62051]